VIEYFGIQDVTTVLLFHEQSSTKHKKIPAYKKSMRLRIGHRAAVSSQNF